MSGPALAIMAREPVPGQVKTRLGPHLTPVQSAELYSAFLHDTVELVASLSTYTPFLAFTPPEAETFFRQSMPPSVSLLRQGDGDLGQKLYSVFRELDQRGYSPILAVGSDHPTMQPDHLEAAVERLRHCQVCLGPSHDGGYYLIGARAAHRCLFEGIPWSTPQVLQATVERAKAAGLSLGLLEICPDVDTIGDLHRLRLEVQQLVKRQGAKVPRCTWAFLERVNPSTSL
ncbi:MAG: TIGR04282 family arsenosugar biosynthesis glycosyltransferase [Chloroflexi bacterium]|nr:TIGR04282 family arsenosugar biosynthesis glycosyltransferase [Chloroflexota bacterium]